MTTITIKEGEELSRTVFQTFDDLIEEYYASKGIVMLHQVDFEDLPEVSQKAIEESRKMGKGYLLDFKG